VDEFIRCQIRDLGCNMARCKRCRHGENENLLNRSLRYIVLAAELNPYFQFLSFHTKDILYLDGK
jgi:hypothetical protein